jgi:hypothetical protein
MIDVKLPIGLMFTLLGGLLLLYGLTTFADEEVYRKALGININLWSGSGMLVFGLTMLAFSRWRLAGSDGRPDSAASTPSQEGGATHEQDA